MRVCPGGAPGVEARCLAGLSLADRAGFMSTRQSVSEEGTDLWDAQTLQNLLRPLIRAIDDGGTVVEHVGPPGEDAAAVVDGSWVLFMRRRLPDYQGFLERMRTLYRDQSVAVPNTLQAVVSDSPSALAAQAVAADSGAPGTPQPFLLPLPPHKEEQAPLPHPPHPTAATPRGPPPAR